MNNGAEKSEKPAPLPKRKSLHLLPPTDLQKLLAESRNLRDQSRNLRRELGENIEQIKGLVVEVKGRATGIQQLSRDTALLWSLTAREQTVLRLIASGNVTKQV